jgi:hypothetical protein
MQTRSSIMIVSNTQTSANTRWRYFKVLTSGIALIVLPLVHQDSENCSACGDQYSVAYPLLWLFPGVPGGPNLGRVQIGDNTSAILTLRSRIHSAKAASGRTSFREFERGKVFAAKMNGESHLPSDILGSFPARIRELVSLDTRHKVHLKSASCNPQIMA